MASDGANAGGAPCGEAVRPSGPIARASGSSAPAVFVAADPVARAAVVLVDWLRARAAEVPAPSEIRLAMPGGSALEVVLRAAPLAGALWRRVALTWVDERCVPVADPESNRGEAGRRGLPSPARVVPLFEDGESPQAAIARVTRRFADELGGGLDLVVLGMGPDGHVASLFPDRTWPESGVVAFVPDSPKPPARRLTLTRTALACARHTLLLATGEAKRDALERVVQGDPTLPATGLPGLVVVTDLELRAQASPGPIRIDRPSSEPELE